MDALPSELVPYWPAKTEETALIVQVLLLTEATMLAIEAMPEKLKSTPLVTDKVLQSTGRDEVSVKTRFRSVSVAEGAVRAFRLPFTTRAELRESEPTAPMPGRVSAAGLLAESAIEPPFSTSALTLE